VHDLRAPERERLREIARREFREAMDTNPWEALYPANAARPVLASAAQNPARRLSLLRESRSLYERALDLQPGNAPVQYVYSQVLLALGSVDPSARGARAAAVRALRRATELNPWQTVYAERLAVLLARDGRRREARAVVTRALERSPRDAELLRLRQQLSR